MAVDIAALVAACTGNGVCPFADMRFKCPQTLECKYIKPYNWQKHIDKSPRIRAVLEQRFPLKERN